MRSPLSALRQLLLVATWCAVATACRGEDPPLPPDLPPVLLQMTRDPAVWQELGLSDEQTVRLQQSLDQVDGPWWLSRNLPLPERAAQIAALTEQLKLELATVLDDAQRQRLWQLERQALGTRMLLLDDVAQTLRVDPVIRHQLADIARTTDLQAAELVNRAAAGERPQELEKELQTLKDRERREVLKKLTSGQQQQLAPLTGEPFAFNKVQRIFPRAPELVGAGSQWLQGDAAARRLSDLRGKVVVVHFYAFQCINCQRNLPHYAAWHGDYADQGLVVIGIQTPETAAESDPQKVAAAAQAEKIAYPVLLDADSQNWQTWGTTMWPTVYLIDRDGYIRSWWQGELNWQAAAGEQQMRRQIESLLAEPPSAPSRVIAP